MNYLSMHNSQPDGEQDNWNMSNSPLAHHFVSYLPYLYQ